MTNHDASFVTYVHYANAPRMSSLQYRKTETLLRHNSALRLIWTFNAHFCSWLYIRACFFK